MKSKHEQRQEAVERLQKLLTGVCGYGDVMNAVLGDAFIYNSSRQDALSLIDLLTDDDMDEYVKLPVDANGEVIHIGDELQWDDGERLTVIGVCNDIVFYVNDDSLGGAQWTKANNKRHYHKPTVEDVLRELVIACEDAGNAGPAVEALISKHAERLRLKEDE